MARTLVRTLKPSPKNILINGDMFFARWGTSLAISTTNRFSVDRWITYRDTDAAGSSMSRQSSGLVETPFCLRIQRDNGNSGVQPITTGQNIETERARLYAGKTVTVSFLARAGATFSGTGLTSNFITATGTNESLRVAMTGQVNNFTPHSLTTSWQRFTYQMTIPSNATQFCIAFGYTPVGTAGASDYFEITQVSIYEGSVFNGFALSTENNQTELEECMRFYQNEFFNALGPAINTTTCFLYFHLNTRMRATPTIRVIPGSSLTNAIDETGTSPRSPSTIIAESPGPGNVAMQASGMSGLTIFRPCRMTANAVEAFAEMI